ncbi:MAG: SDR family NAD(P)-dependent oxidoreductase, partial [Solirubrobacterales bacterium]
MADSPTFADLSGRTALVTGCGSAEGIGFATARLLGRQGAAVVITSTTERIHDRAEELAEEGIEAMALVADLIEADRAADVVEQATAWKSGLDILVNNAGMAQEGADEDSRPFAELSDAEWRTGIDRNLYLAANVTRAAIGAITDSGQGRIIFVTSVTGPLVAIHGSSAYGAAKAGLDGLMRALALELGPTGTTVNSVNPGWIATASSTEAELPAGRNTPAGRPGTPEEGAAAGLRLASP